MQSNYAVTVREPYELRLNSEEHSEWMWAEEDKIDDLLMTPAMSKVLRDSFEFSKTNSIP